MRMSLLLVFLFTFLGPAASTVAQSSVSQNPCELALQKAARDYRAGRVDDVFVIRQTCLEGRSSRTERVRAWALLAEVHLALDQLAQATEAVDALVGLDPEYRTAPDAPPELADLVATAKGRFTVRVGTVSKTDEPLRKAPATVVVLTAEDIERRGYLDLEQLLHDLPGFDISRGNGDVYSNVYMRGYRSDRSDRLLFLVDGVEQNDLHSGTAYISRQYALSHIAQVEVVYGPASTIYGADAFTGVISITTKLPKDLIGEGDMGEADKVAVTAQLTSGSFATRSVDATVAGRNESGRLSWSLTGRLFQSDEPDLSAFPEWDYDFGAALDDLDYQDLLRIDGALAQELGDILEFSCFFTGYCDVIREGDQVLAIEATEAGAEAARDRDRQLFALLAASAGNAFSFSDPTDDWSLDAKLQFSNLTFGLQTWRREEGTTPWYNDFLRASGDAGGSISRGSISRGNVWTPMQTSIYARYSQPIGGSVQLNLFSRFKQHEQDGDSSIARFVTYAGQALSLIDLAGFDTISTFQAIDFDQKSTQFRNEVTLVYEPTARFNLMGGVELRSSSVQAEFKSSVPFQVPPGFAFFREQVLSTKIDTTDLGIFAQASYQPRDDWKLVVGGRVDTNSVRDQEAFLLLQTPSLPGFPAPTTEIRLETEGSGTVFNPRLALIHTRGDVVLKAIYAEAFKAPSNFQRFTREPGVREFPSPDLESEKVRNLDLGFSWHSNAGLLVDVVAYQANYSNAVALRQQVNADTLDFPINSGRFENLGRLQIRGAAATASYRYKNYEFHGNYTYTDPFNIDPVDDLGKALAGVDKLRIGDIASHRLNLGVHASWGQRWSANLRANYVGARKTGDGTTVRDNPLGEIEAYFVTHATASYRGLLPGATWQLIVNNLFDTDYDHPGVQRAGVGFVARLPQPGRAVFLRLIYRR